MSKVASQAGANRLMRVMLERRGAAVAGVLILSVALTVFLAACGQQSKTVVPRADGTIVMEDFESGALSDWKAVSNGAGGWFVYGNGKKGLRGARISADAASELPDPPRASSRRRRIWTARGRWSCTGT